MKFAIVNGIRIEPAPGLRGVCPCCGFKTIAKCGKFKVWHWAHKSRTDCDAWWENETEWHRHWKNLFPTEWQEHVMHDLVTGERHVADVYTKSGVAIEFQHSVLSAVELESREAFYRDVVWIVDGNRGELDRSNFYVGFATGANVVGDNVNLKWYGRGKVFERWRIARCPVFFDFGDGVLWKLLDYDPKTKYICTQLYLSISLINHLNQPSITALKPVANPIEIINKITALHRVC